MIRTKRLTVSMAMGVLVITGVALAASLYPDPKTISTALNTETNDYEGSSTIFAQSTVSGREYELWASPDWSHSGQHPIYWVDMFKGSNEGSYESPLTFTGDGGNMEIILVVGSPYTDAWMDLELWEYVEVEDEVWEWVLADESEVRALNN